MRLDTATDKTLNQNGGRDENRQLGKGDGKLAKEDQF